MISTISRHWWVPALRGLVSMLFGVAAFVIPSLTLAILIAFVGAYLFVDGVFALVQAIRFRHESERWPALLVEGIVGIGIGVATYLWPSLAAIAWLYTIAAWAVFSGVLEIVAAIRLRREISGEWLLILTGIASIAFGLLMAAMPLAGLLAWIWIVGAYAIVFGALLIGLGFRLRKVAVSAAA